MNLTQGIGSPSTIGILQDGIRSLYNDLGHTPTTQLGAPKPCSKLHNSKSSRHHQPSRVHNAPKRHKLFGNTMHPRVTRSSNFNFHESSWRAQTDAPNAMARAQVLKSFTLKFQQSNKCLWGNKRGRTTKKSTNESQKI